MFREVIYTLPVSEGKKLAWLHSHGKVLSQEMLDDELLEIKVQLSEENIGKFGSLIKS